MEKAYIILAHKNRQQLRRMVEKLNDGQSVFFIHIDKKVSIDDFYPVDNFSNKIRWLDRINTDWGGFGLVQATLNALNAILAENKEFHNIFLLSGQDYPIKSSAYINQFLEKSQFRNFIEYTIIPDYRRWKPRGGMYRLDRYFMGLKAHERYGAKTLNFISRLMPVFGRKQPKMIPYAGSQWWILDMASIRYILGFLENNPWYTKFHRYTFAPDELFFHTILLNAQDEQIKKSIKNESMLFMNWNNSENPHPDILTKKDFNSIIQSGALFARKFDENIDREVLDLIDAYSSDQKVLMSM